MSNAISTPLSTCSSAMCYTEVVSKLRSAMAEKWALKYALVWCLVNVLTKVIKQVRWFLWTKCFHCDKQCDGNSDTEKIHSLVTPDNVGDIFVQFYCHGISDKLCIWHNIMLILGRALWRWNEYLLLMNVNLTEVLEADTAVRPLQNKKDRRQVVWVLAMGNNWTETSMLEKATIRDQKKSLFGITELILKCFVSRLWNMKSSNHWKEEINHH